MNSKRQPPPPQAELVRIACAADSCDATTDVVASHADNLRGRWRCSAHYRGAFARPEVQA